MFSITGMSSSESKWENFETIVKHLIHLPRYPQICWICQICQRASSITFLYNPPLLDSLWLIQSHIFIKRLKTWLALKLPDRSNVSDMTFWVIHCILTLNQVHIAKPVKLNVKNHVLCWYLEGFILIRSELFVVTRPRHDGLRKDLRISVRRSVPGDPFALFLRTLKTWHSVFF